MCDDYWLQPYLHKLTAKPELFWANTWRVLRLTKAARDCLPLQAAVVPVFHAVFIQDFEGPFDDLLT